MNFFTIWSTGLKQAQAVSYKEFCGFWETDTEVYMEKQNIQPTQYWRRAKLEDWH